jgi:predicted helicase
VAKKSGDLRNTVGPENVLHYAYAVFHSPSYRQRYGEFLKYDFPRLPLTADRELFRALSSRGAELVALHLRKRQGPAQTTFPIRGDDCVRRVWYVASERASGRGRVWINATQSFDGVPPEVWQFQIGGYPVCRKWLTDRRGRPLSPAEQARYIQVIAALSESVRLMQEIDDVIQAHGGWPMGAARR